MLRACVDITDLELAVVEARRLAGEPERDGEHRAVLLRERERLDEAAALLAASTVATLAITVLPQINQRLFAIPTGVALVGLGYSLWREQRTRAALPMPGHASSQLDPAGAK